jgi:UDPglucose 6-dehydrogenase
MRLPIMSIPFLPKPKILIIGYGLVGNAVAQNLVDNGFQVEILDPAKNKNVRSYNCAAAIICVNTPIGEDGRCNDRNVVEAIHIAERLVTSKRIMVKSTVTPDLVAKYPKQVVMNPEFLRQTNAYEDFTNQKFMVLGGDAKQIQWWDRIFKHIKCPRVKTTREGAVWFKYIHNTWLATKVVFFHELHQAAAAYDQLNDLHEAIEGVKHHDAQVGPSHMYAPNLSGTLGYDGACFPKDTAAFAQFTNTALINEITKINDRLNNEQL